MNQLTLLKNALKTMCKMIPVAGLLIGSAQAEEFVDTMPQNRKVILEEFTGLNCTWCPAGHKIADDIKSNNPESVFLVNIHTGIFASPSGSQPDFRTGLGSAIDNLMNVQGYPSATINRTPYTGNKALNRENWEAAADEILSQSSPVNVAIQTDFNESNRELEVKVEAYYTGNSGSNTNMLNVALLQNNIPGPQVDGSNSYPDNYYSNGQYNHKHMLRDFLTGQWGDTIQHPVKDSLFTKTYTYEIPKEFQGVSVKPQFLQVTAYVSEDKENVYTGATEEVEVDNQYFTDLSVSQNTESPKDLCDNTLIPQYTVTNNGSEAVDSFTASIRFEDAKHTKTFHPNIGPGESQQIEFDEVSISGGEFTLRFNNLYALNGNNLFDDNIENNFPDEVRSGYAFVEHPFWKAATASFDNGSVPDHFALDNSGNPNSAAFSNSRNPAGVDGSNGALYQFLDASIDNTDKTNHLIFGRMNLSELEDPYFVYYYSYTEGNKNVEEGPKVRLEMSEDCGASWETLRTDSLSETVSYSSSENTYIPGSGDYAKVWMSLEAYKDKDDVIFRASIEPGDDGHIIWLDEVSVGAKSRISGIENEGISSNIALYPNPVSQGQATFNFEFDQEKEVGIDIVNAQGKTVKAIQPQTFSQGSSEFEVNTSALTAGIYIAKLNVDGKMETIQFIVND